jgi:3-phosphoglycerate kinase
LLDIHDSELLFFEVLDDLKEYLDDLVIVGGWLVYLFLISQGGYVHRQRK